jgi:hypothetical protein
MDVRSKVFLELYAFFVVDVAEYDVRAMSMKQLDRSLANPICAAYVN